ncbi:MAG TPA: HAD-IIIA family hydrolase [Flavobacteriaceae bacterium]|nr:HAD-IIIA family hydrolase [Flavobacteriaceae bacterium]
MDQNYKITLRQISTFIFDVDGVLTNGQLLVSTDGELLREMSVRDGFAIKKAIQAGYNVCIISGGKNEGVRKRLEGLGVTDIYLGIDDKIESLNEYFKKNQINAENVVYMGDDIPDIPPMKMVGLTTCPQDAIPEVKLVSTYISHRKGGEGCVRDLIEQVMKIQGKWKY